MGNTLKIIKCVLFYIYFSSFNSICSTETEGKLKSYSVTPVVSRSVSGEPAVHAQLVMTNLQVTALLRAGTLLVIAAAGGDAGNTDSLQPGSVVVVSVRQGTLARLVARNIMMMMMQGRVRRMIAGWTRLMMMLLRI